MGSFIVRRGPASPSRGRYARGILHPRDGRREQITSLCPRNRYGQCCRRFPGPSSYFIRALPAERAGQGRNAWAVAAVCPRAKPGTPAAEDLGFGGEAPRLARRAETLAREVRRLVRKARSFACKAKSLAAGALSLGRDLSAPARSVGRRLRLGGGGHGPDLGLAGELGGGNGAGGRGVGTFIGWARGALPILVLWFTDPADVCYARLK